MADAGEYKSIARLLLDSASQDLAACRLLAVASGIGDGVVGFHTQQAVEKSLKAVLSGKPATSALTGSSQLRLWSP